MSTNKEPLDLEAIRADLDFIADNPDAGPYIVDSVLFARHTRTLLAAVDRVVDLCDLCDWAGKRKAHRYAGFIFDDAGDAIRADLVRETLMRGAK